MSAAARVPGAAAGTVTEAPVTGPGRSPGPTAPAASTAGLLRGEWVKMVSLRSTWFTLLGALLGMLVLGLLFTMLTDPTAPADGGGPQGPGASDPTGLSLAGYTLAQLIIATLGVMLVTGEYATGTVRTTLAATPRRWPVPLAKALVLAALLAPLAMVASVATFLVGQAALGDAGASITDTGVVRVLVGTALYLTAIALLGSGLGWLLRGTAAGITTIFALVFILPVLGGLLPATWGPDLVRWLPSEAGSSVLELTAAPGAFGPWAGFAVLCGWVLASFGAAIAVLRRRDA